MHGRDLLSTLGRNEGNSISKRSFQGGWLGWHFASRDQYERSERRGKESYAGEVFYSGLTDVHF